LFTVVVDRFAGATDRKLNPEYTTIARIAVDTDGTVHRLHQTFGNNEADTAAFDISALFAEPIKRLEQMRLLLDGQSRARVSDGNAHSIVLLAARNGNAAIFTIVFHGVGQLIENDLTHAHAIRVNDEIKIATCADHNM